jgi:hypothetical protein
MHVIFRRSISLLMYIFESLLAYTFISISLFICQIKKLHHTFCFWYLSHMLVCNNTILHMKIVGSHNESPLCNHFHDKNYSSIVISKLVIVYLLSKSYLHTTYEEFETTILCLQLILTVYVKISGFWRSHDPHSSRSST